MIEEGHLLRQLLGDFAQFAKEHAQRQIERPLAVSDLRGQDVSDFSTHSRWEVGHVDRRDRSGWVTPEWRAGGRLLTNKRLQFGFAAAAPPRVVRLADRKTGWLSPAIDDHGAVGRRSVAPGDGTRVRCPREARSRATVLD